MTLWNKIKYTGIWIQPVAMAASTFVLKDFPVLSENTPLLYSASFAVSLLPVAYTWAWNKRDKKNYKKESFGMLDGLVNSGPDPNAYLPSKKNATYPPVSPALLHDKPCGVVMGKHKGKYVCNEGEGHYLIVGGSGTGKSSSLLIPTLLSSPENVYLILDIKKELSSISFRKDDPSLVVFDPQDRSQYGFDPFYKLSSTSTQQEIYETMQMITLSLINLPADIKDPFWIKSAQNLLIGLMMYFYELGVKNLIDIIDSILNSSISETVNAACDHTEKGSIAFHHLIQFKDMETETISGIFAELSNHIQVFANDNNIRYAFRDNPLKINPEMLEEGKSISIAIAESKLSAYTDVIKMIFNLTFSTLLDREVTPDSKRIIIVLDEIARLESDSKLEMLPKLLQTGRSRYLSCIVCMQALEGMLSAISEPELLNELSNCSYKIILDATSSKTIKMVSEWCGTYRCKHKSWDGTGSKRKVSVSYEDKPIVEASDLMTLSNSGELILISPHGYNRIQKTYYFKDPYLKKLADEIKAYNNSITSSSTMKGDDDDA